MLRNKSWHGMLAVGAAVFFGMLAVGCGKDDNPTGGGNTPPELNGTWDDNYGSILILNKGSFEMRERATDDEGEYTNTELRVLKGTFSTSGDKFTLKPTHVHGEVFSSEIGDESPLPLKWYTQKELIAEFKKLLGPLYDLYFGEMFGELIGELFMTRTGPYTLDGDELTIDFDDELETFTKRK